MEKNQFKSSLKTESKNRKFLYSFVNRKFSNERKSNLENKFQKTLKVYGAGLSLIGLISLSGCGHYLPCPAYTNNPEERGIMKMDSIDIAIDYGKQDTIETVMNYSNQNYQLNN